MTTKRYDGISAEKRDGIGFVFFDNPAHNNRMGYKETTALTQALLDMGADREVRVLILSGKGDSFCSGGKIDGFPEGPLVDQWEYSNAGIRLLNTFYKLSKPIIAAVNADALAGGLMFIEACDLAVAGRDVMFGLPEIKRGYFPMLALAVLEKAVPKKRLFEMAFTGKLVDGETMLAWNLLNELTEPGQALARAEEIAREIAAFSAMPLAFGRNAYYRMYNMDLADSLEYSKCALLNLLWTDDVRETQRAADEGRPPVYRGQ